MLDTSQREVHKHIPSRAVVQFLTLFRGRVKANNAKAVRLRVSRDEILGYQRSRDILGILLSLPRMTRAGSKCVYIKVQSGRGRKRASWVAAVHGDMLQDFERLRKTSLIFNVTFLRQLAIHLIGQFSNEDYPHHMRDTKSEKRIVDIITPRRVQSFMNRFRIVIRAQPGKSIVSPEKRLRYSVIWYITWDTCQGSSHQVQ